MSQMSTVDYEEGLLADLRDPVFAVCYLSACFEEDAKDAQEKRQIIISALNQVIKAQDRSA